MTRLVGIELLGTEALISVAAVNWPLPWEDWIELEGLRVLLTTRIFFFTWLGTCCCPVSLGLGIADRFLTEGFGKMFC